MDLLEEREIAERLGPGAAAAEQVDGQGKDSGGHPQEHDGIEEVQGTKSAGLILFLFFADFAD